MKILFLANRTPYPPYRGDKLKIFNLAKRLCKEHELHLLTFAQSEEDFTYKEELEKYFKEVHLVSLPKWKSAVNCLRAGWKRIPLQVLYFWSKEMKEKLDEVMSVNKFDAIHVQHLRMSPYLCDNTSVPRILDLPDAFSLYWKRRAEAETNPFKKVFNSIEYKRLLDYEKLMIGKYNLSLVCSFEDLEYLQQVHQLDNVRLLPNGVDTNTFKAVGHDYSHNRTILFTGNMDYAPNIDAVQYFVEEIFPTVRKEHPDVEFVIAGQRPVKKVSDLASDKIKVTGFVKNLAEVYNSASVVVAPLRFGAGTQNKVLEAMAIGVPVVCTEVGFKGLGVLSGDGVVMRMDKEGFAKEVIKLLNSEDYRRRTGEKGVEVINQKYDWDIVASSLEGYFMSLAK